MSGYVHVTPIPYNCL